MWQTKMWMGLRLVHQWRVACVYFYTVSILPKKAESVCKCASRCLVQDSTWATARCVWSQVTVQVAKLHISSRYVSLIKEDRDTETAIVGRDVNVEANEVQYSETTAFLWKEHPVAENTTKLQPRLPGIISEVWNRVTLAFWHTNCNIFKSHFQALDWRTLQLFSEPAENHCLHSTGSAVSTPPHVVKKEELTGE